MHITPPVRALALRRAAWLLGGITAVAMPFSCSESSSTPAPTATLTPVTSPVLTDASARLQAIRAHFRGALDSLDGGTPRFDATSSGSFRAVLPQRAEGKTASVELPSHAEGPVRLTDDASRLSVSFALEGAAEVEIGAAEGIAVYAAAAPGGGDVLHRVGPSGTEDFVFFGEAPVRKELRYRVDVTAVAGLRLVASTLELLDSSGTPRLRVSPPYVLGADGARHEASLGVEGCAVDSSPQAPWGRPVTSPGASSCIVAIRWPEAGVRYPALVDPKWGTTFNDMEAARTRHTITLLNPSDPKSAALIVGGFASVGGAPLKTAELYDPLSRRFSPTGSLNVARGNHTATLLTKIIPPTQLGTSDPVLIAGGSDDAGKPLGSLEVYDAASGTFLADMHTMATYPRFNHTATLVADNQVLLAGGITLPLNQPTNTAYVYTFTSFLPGNPAPTDITSTLADAATIMTSSRTAHAAVRLNTGEVLLTGGFVLAGGAFQALQTAELYNPNTKAFGAITMSGVGQTLMSFQRGFHTATLLKSGTVLIVGGLSKTVGGISTNTIDLYADGAGGTIKGFVPQLTPIIMNTGRSNHTATLLPTGDVLIAGGFGGLSALASAEIFSAQSQTFSFVSAQNPMVARGDHAAVLINAGDSITAGRSVLVTGGSTSPTPGAGALAGAQILLQVNGDPCTLGDECLSGFCADGVCCDTACTQECYACSPATKQSGDQSGTCGYAIKGADPRVQCLNEIEVHTQCDGKGSTEQIGTTKDCKPGVCGADNLCSTFCATTKDCSQTGFCDLTAPSDAGVGLSTCAPRRINSTVCTADEQCQNSHCVDGLCCDLACEGQCQACDIPGFPGKCLPIGSPSAPEQPHPNLGGVKPRAACDGVASGVVTSCAGRCTGNPDPLLCQYPGSTETLQGKACADVPGAASTLTAYPCDSKGTNTKALSDCGGFLCANASSCKTVCTEDAECIADWVCTDKVCQQLTGPLCDGTNVLRQPAAKGGNTTCPDHFTCPVGATACLTTCGSVGDCAEGRVCNNDGKCVDRLVAPTELASCSTRRPGGSSSDPIPWALALAALAVVRRRPAR